MMELLHKDITDRILKAFYKVYNVLGYGFLEKVYENAMFIELAKQGLRVIKQQYIKVLYDGQEVGEYFADLLVEDAVIYRIEGSRRNY